MVWEEAQGGAMRSTNERATAIFCRFAPAFGRVVFRFAQYDAGLKPHSISRARAAAENAGGLDVSAIWAVFWDLYVGPSALGFVGLGT